MNIQELIAAALGRSKPAAPPAPPPAEFDPNAPWNAPALAPAPQPTPSPTPMPGAGAGMPAGYEDPNALAASLADRNAAVSQLAAPATQTVELPLDLLVNMLGLRPAPKK